MLQWIKSIKMPTKTQGNLVYTSTVEMSPDDWLGFRGRGIGASEVGYIMGLSPYKSNVELFYEKIGEKLGYNLENIAMFMVPKWKILSLIYGSFGAATKVR